MRKVLVTGATGFVGSHVLEALAGDEEIVLIAACRDRSKLPAAFAGEVREGDLLDPSYVASVCQDADTVCHAAAWTSMYGHERQSRELFLAPSLALIDAAKTAGVKRLVNVSTTSAASPDTSANAMSQGIPRQYWPHLCNVIAIEDHLRKQSGEQFLAINLRLGLFAGSRYALGLLPILLPRLKTHLVPWVAGGRTSMPIIDGRDIGQAFLKAVQVQGLRGYESFNVVGPTVPKAREVIEFICREYGYPRPHFGVPFPIAFVFAYFMELLDPIVPWEPLITRSIVHLLREVNADNARAKQVLGYVPSHHWQDAVRLEIEEMKVRQRKSMSMARPIGERA